MARPCPACGHTPDECSYRGQARPGCLLDKHRRDEATARLKGVTTKELRARIKARAQEVLKKD